MYYCPTIARLFRHFSFTGIDPVLSSVELGSYPKSSQTQFASIFEKQSCYWILVGTISCSGRFHTAAHNTGARMLKTILTYYNQLANVNVLIWPYNHIGLMSS